jgi:uncharacterized protein (TIGR02145 family)
MTTASIYVNPNATPKNDTEMNNYREVLAAGMKPCQRSIVVPAGGTGRHHVGITDAVGNLHVMAHEEDVSDLAASIISSVDVDGTTIEGDGVDTPLAVKDAGITTAKIADSSVTTAKIADASVSIAKIEKVGSITGTLKEGNDSRTLRDIAGNVYRTVKIDGVEWMAENLRVTRYNDGTAIPEVTDGSTWAGLSTPAFCWYNNDSGQGYGALYNWFTVDPENVKKIAPKGWRVSTMADWSAMADYLIANGYNWDGTLTGNKIANALLATGSNSSGFTGQIGGFRNQFGAFGGIDVSPVGIWWTSTKSGASSGFSNMLSPSWENLELEGSENNLKGFSLRLVRGGRNTVGAGGASYPGTAVQTAGYDVVSVAAAASTNYYTLEDGYDGQELTVVNIGDVDAYVGFALIGADEARRAIWLDGAWRAY